MYAVFTFDSIDSMKSAKMPKKNGNGSLYAFELLNRVKIGFSRTPKERISTHANYAAMYGKSKIGRIAITSPLERPSYYESVIHQFLSDYRESKTNEFFYVSFEDAVSVFRVLLPDFEIIENGKIKPVNLLSLRMLGLARQKRLQEQNKTKE